MSLLLGKPAAQQLRETQFQRANNLRAKDLVPRLDIILLCRSLDESPYVLAKKRACEDIGIECVIHQFPLHTSQSDLLHYIHALNHDSACGALICQLPLGAHIDTEEVVRAIDKTKDIDGFHPENLGGLALGHSDVFVPCTPAGILYLLRYYNIPLLGKHIVILGRSRIVGLPLHLLLSQKTVGATVTLCHSQTPRLADFCRRADILIAATGKAHLVKADWISSEAILVDVGITQVPDPNAGRGYSLQGDIDPEAGEKARAVTPVPGGVGPLTVAMVIENCLKAWEKRLD